LLTVSTVTGQSLLAPGEGVRISFATGNIQYKDYLLNGLRNSGLNLSFGVDYAITKHSLNHEVGLSADLAALWNRYGWDSYCIQPIIPNFHYRLLADVKDIVQIGGNFNYSSMFYMNENWDSHHNYWRTCFSVEFSACYHYNINQKWTLFVPLNLPVVGFLSRPAEDRNLILNEPDIKYSDIIKRIHSHFQFVAIGYKYFEIETGIFFGVQLKSTTKLTFGYKLLYEQTTLSLKSQLFTNQLSIQYSFKKQK
jgi:hypothetical protein